MKKIFTTLSLCCALGMGLETQATEYTDQLEVVINNQLASQSTDQISVSKNEDGTYTLTLKNFILNSGDEVIPVGTINIASVSATEFGTNNVRLAFADKITIENGDSDGVSEWLGPNLEEVPVDIVGFIYGDGKFYANININMASLGQVISVNFGTAPDASDMGYQMPGRDFENWRKVSDKLGSEPDGWHSFATAGGNLASTAKAEQVKIAVGHNGGNCAQIFSRDVKFLGSHVAYANGTLTNGQMIAGSADASNTKNHAESNTSNGSDYYTNFFGNPDAVEVWVKYVDNSNGTKASISAAITDGTFYQEPWSSTTQPENLIGRANKTDIAPTSEWTKVTVPFKYYETGKATKSILVTMSTSATPGAGKGNEQLYVDELNFVYNKGLKSFKINGADALNQTSIELPEATELLATEVEVEVDGYAAKVNSIIVDPITDKEIEGNKVEHTTTVTVNVVAGDYSTASYTCNVKLKTTEKEAEEKPGDTPTAIGETTNEPATVVSIYTFTGTKVNNLNRPGVYIVKYSNGTAKRVIKK